MAKRQAKRVKRKLTPDEKQRVKRVREKIKDELPEIKWKGRAHKRASLTARKLIATLKEAREQQGLSLADLKERTGISREAICALENSDSPNPTISTLIRYADAVGMQIKAEPTN